MKELSPKELADVLASGKYKKGHGQLGYQREGEWHFCCLGVYAEEGDLPRIRAVDGSGEFYELQVKNPAARSHDPSIYDEDSWQSGVLPEAAAPAWMLETPSSSSEPFDNVMCKLAHLNDNDPTWEPVINYLRTLET